MNGSYVVHNHAPSLLPVTDLKLYLHMAVSILEHVRKHSIFINIYIYKSLILFEEVLAHQIL